MARQPFRFSGFTQYTIGHDCLVRRPLFATLIAGCNDLWTNIELQLSLALGAIRNSNSLAAVGVYLSIQNARSQRDALLAAAVAHEPQSTGALPSPGTAGTLPRGTAGAQPPSTASARLADNLSTALKLQLTSAGFTPDLKPFRAHVTLARKVSHSIPTMEMDPVVWRFTEFALVDSRTGPGGSAYRVLTSFPWGSHEGFDP